MFDGNGHSLLVSREFDDEICAVRSSGSGEDAVGIVDDYTKTRDRHPNLWTAKAASG